ncbi:MAG: phosphonoacetaldehyde reductase [Rhodobacteraceae bacterium]|nr:phosphonoacetaldehyde reductase [Paracoccaceae bacterium]
MWTYWNPVRISFGPGGFDQVAGQLGGRRYLLVTYPDGFAAELGARVAAEAGAPVLVIDDIAPNPDLAALERQMQRVMALETPPDVILALGGGSVIDSAKVFAAAARDGLAAVVAHLRDRPDAARFDPLPIIAVPTTAGTGSEVTSWATVWDSAAGRKYSLSLPGLYPETAIVDPALMMSKPRDLTVSTGLDAFSHALESLWNHHATPVSRLYAVAAAREILTVLPALASDLGNPDLRSRMAQAALFAGIAFSGTRTAIAHSISYPITLSHGVIHGIACSFTLPAIARSLEGIGGPVAEAIEAALGAPPGPAAAARLERFLHRLDVSTLPGDYGIDPQGMQDMVRDAFDGERGQNFIGQRTALLESLKTMA